MSSRRLGGVVLLLVGIVVLLPTPARSEAVQVLSLRFEGRVGTPVTAPLNRGTDTDVVTSVVTAGGGALLVGESRPGLGRALDFPVRADTEAGKLAVLKVVDSDLADGDSLAPGTADFTFGADFRVDGGIRVDPGNNLVQRGLSGSARQYKIQVDELNGRPRPECVLGQRIDGTWVTAKATSPRAVSKAAWYRVVCQRNGTALVLSVFSFAADGTRSLWSRQRVAGVPLFDLTWGTEASPTPMTVGGKLRPDGSFDPDNDQFNGLVDNVMLTIG